MELDTKQKVLLAIYSEYQKDIPNMVEGVTPEKLGLDYDEFKIALLKLENEGYIKGVDKHYGGDDPLPIMIWWNAMMMTRSGIEYVENKLDIDPTLSGREKVNKVKKKAAELGLEHVKDVAAKVIAEILKKSLA